MKEFIKMVFASCLGVILSSVVVMFIFFAAIGAAVQGMMKTFGQGKQPDLSVPSESVLLLDVNGNLDDKAIADPFSELNKMFNTDKYEGRREYTLPELLRAIEIARTDSRIEAIVLKMDNASMGFAAAQELRDALATFRKSGKQIIAYQGEYGNFGSYYVNTVADKLYASPEANIPVTGLASTTIFQKGLLAKLGIEMQVFKVGTYKGAVEPYILDKLSPENRMQIQSYLDGLWNGTINEMAKDRKISPSVYQAFADRALFLAPVDSALNMGLVDSLVYKTDIDQVMANAIFGEGADVDDLDFVRAENLLFGAKEKSGEKIAVIYAEGNIVDYMGNEDENPFMTINQIDNRLAETLKEVAADDDYKAVVLRVNSPGGSARVSELIAREVIELKKKKPIVVSMGNYAASGGYYISSNANAIVAEPYTLTGSIGIFGLFPNATEGARKLALTYDTVKTGEMADMGNIFRPMRPEEKAVMQRMIEQGYDKFLTRVATGRNMQKAEVDAVGQGRVWLGQQALERKLVDKIGGIQTALDEAARLADLDEYRAVVVEDDDNIFNTIFSTKLSKVYNYFKFTNEEKLYYRAAQLLKGQTGIMARPDFSLEQINMGGSDDSYMMFLGK